MQRYKKRATWKENICIFLTPECQATNIRHSATLQKPGRNPCETPPKLVFHEQVYGGVTTGLQRTYTFPALWAL